MVEGGLEVTELSNGKLEVLYGGGPREITDLSQWKLEVLEGGAGRGLTRQEVPLV